MTNILNNNSDKGQEISSIKLEDISIFNGDDYFVFLYKKASKICTAVHLISDFFGQDEALRRSIREASIHLVNKAMSLMISPSPERKQILGELSGYSLEIIALSDVATNVGLESLMNNQILKSEILGFIQFVEEKEVPSKLGSGYVLQEGFLAVDTLNVKSAGESKEEERGGEVKKAEVQNKGQSVGNIVMPKRHSPVVPEKAPVREMWPKLDSAIKEEKVVLKNSPVALREELGQGDRKSKILALIKAKGEVSIKDIVDDIPGCSEKTVQRDLVSLIYAGKIQKEGERRWSKYSIIN